MKKFVVMLKWLSTAFILRKMKGKFVYLTFDDGPHRNNTPQLLKILKKFNVKATFFMVGTEIEKSPDLVQQVKSHGHSIGYHSYDHTNAKEINFFDMYQDLSKAQKLEEKYNFSFNKLYRPPYGALTLSTTAAILIKGWKIVLWSRDSMDSFTDKENVIKNISCNNINEGDVVLLHDDNSVTAETMDTVLHEFNKQQILCNKL